MKKIFLWLPILLWLLLLWYLWIDQLSHDREGTGLDLWDYDDEFSYITDDIIADLWWDKTTCPDGVPRLPLWEVCDDGDPTTTNDVVAYFGCGCQWVVDECPWGWEPWIPWTPCMDWTKVISANGCACVNGVNIWWNIFASQSFDEDDNWGRVRPEEDNIQEEILSNSWWQVPDSSLMAWMNMWSWQWSMAWCYAAVWCDWREFNLAHNVPEDATFDIINNSNWTVIESGMFVATEEEPNMLIWNRIDAEYIPACWTPLMFELSWWEWLKEITPWQMPCECQGVSVQTTPECWDTDYEPAVWWCNYGYPDQNDWLPDGDCTALYSETSTAKTCEYCSLDCMVEVVSGEYCGDGIKQSNETCDPADTNETNRWTNWCSENCEKQEYVCGDDWFDATQDNDNSTDCSDPLPEGETCTASPWTSCTYCNESCETVTINTACEIPVCPQPVCDAWSRVVLGNTPTDANGCESCQDFTCEKIQCGETWFNYALDDDVTTNCNAPQTPCIPSAWSSCTYCNNECDEIEVSVACSPTTPCANPQDFCGPGQQVQSWSWWPNYDTYGCQISCKTPICVCENTNQAPQGVWTSCNDNNTNTTNDVIQDDGCSCAWEIVIVSDPVCGDDDYVPSSWWCAYGYPDQNGWMLDDACSVDYSDADAANTCAYCADDCTVVTITGEYCWDGVVQTQEECDPTDSSEINRWTNWCNESCEKVEYVCGDEEFDSSIDDDENTNCNTPQVGCETSALGSCEYCNESCELTILEWACFPVPDCANPNDYCAPGEMVQEGSTWWNYEGECPVSCKTPICVCENTNDVPQAVWVSCDDNNAETINDVIQDDGCTCLWVVEFTSAPVCGDVDYIPDAWWCNYGYPDQNNWMLDDACVVVYSDSDTANTCEYCADDCSVATISGEYCWDWVLQVQEDCDPADSSETNRWTNWCTDTCLISNVLCEQTNEVPQEVWISCDDNNVDTLNDMIQEDGCTCAWELQTYSRSVWEYEECSLTCGGGISTRSVSCIHDLTLAIVADEYCNLPVPAVQQSCNTQACETYDRFADDRWTCSELCGGWMREREVQCRRYSDNTIVDESLCATTKPEPMGDCNIDVCETYERSVDDRGICDANCDGWTRTRSVSCVSTSNNLVVSDEFCGEPRPQLLQSCNTQVCEVYNREVENRWACSATCGTWDQERIVTCVDLSWATVSDSLCVDAKPLYMRSCNTQECEIYNRSAWDWSECSALCWWGSQTREVICVDRTNEEVISSTLLCDWIKPSDTMNCNMSACIDVISTARWWWWSWARKVSYCWDWVLNSEDETCDDGNYLDGDGCDRFCKEEIYVHVCWDGILDQTTENCDDGNTTNNDGCSSACMVEVLPMCWDGLVNQSSEECDDGNKNNSDACTNACLIKELPVCGDGLVNQLLEECDDGNTSSLDGCSRTCLIEVDEIIIDQIRSVKNNLPQAVVFDSVIDLPVFLPKTWAWIGK